MYTIEDLEKHKLEQCVIYTIEKLEQPALLLLVNIYV